jgi:hypothetical protein
LAAGMLDMKLVPLTAAFFAGRIVSYSIYVSVATIADKNLGSVLGQYLGSPLSIAIQVVFLLLVALLPFLNWSKLLRRYARPVDPAPSDNSDLTNGARAHGRHYVRLEPTRAKPDLTFDPMVTPAFQRDDKGDRAGAKEV